MKFLKLFLLLVALTQPEALFAQSYPELPLVRKLLSELQAPSFEKNREFCGWVGRNASGTLVVGKTYRGRRANCSWRFEHDDKVTLVATYHTHGSYLYRYDNEIPSIVDFVNHVRLKARGYVATPGGRLWVVDGVRREVLLICGPGCLPVDPGHKEKPNPRLRKRFTEKQLFDRAGIMSLEIELCGDNLCTN